jgi:L-ascorbate metabolism protein UlaG (beta-lactamase superfamily)
MQPWASAEVAGRDGSTVTVTAVPAQHGPRGSEDQQGQVIGFILAAHDAEPVYVSGDNASRRVVREIVERIGVIPIAVLNVGAVQLAKFDGAYLTLSADHAADVTEILGARVAVPLHFEGWAHFTQDAAALTAAFTGNGLSDRLVLLGRGERREV